MLANYIGRSTLTGISRKFSTKPSGSSENSYVRFAKTYPFANNVIIATVKTAVADLIA